VLSKATAISLFTSGGIGDLALRASGFDILVSNEMMPERHAVFECNFPSATSITGDIWTRVGEIEEATRHRLAGRELSLLYATPPCQGMSKNGRGKLLNAVRAGRKPPSDPRNRLIIPTLELAKRLKPETLLFENVPEMSETVILDASSRAIGIIDLIREQLGSEYDGRAEVVEFADYGVPQRRQRLITVFTRSSELRAWFDSHGSVLPVPTHARTPRSGQRAWVTVRDAISGFPPLDAGTPSGATSDIPFHKVPLLDEMKYWWVRRTPPERGAFDNQCDGCGWDQNATHVANRAKDGINRASTATPLFCERCGSLLPRPHVERDGVKQIMRGFTSAYKRMSFDKPATALTRNLSYACSDNKLHPVQHRVLSLREAFAIHTIDRYVYHWCRKDGKRVADKVIREIIGESIPPLGLQCITDHLIAIRDGKGVRPRNERAQLMLELNARE